MKLLHPSAGTLQRWLNGDGDSAVDLHVGTCQRCAGALEEMESAGVDGIGEALAEALAPPEDLTVRLTERVSARVSSRQLIEVIADLFGAALETSRLLLTDGPDDYDRRSSPFP